MIHSHLKFRVPNEFTKPVNSCNNRCYHARAIKLTVYFINCPWNVGIRRTHRRANVIDLIPSQLQDNFDLRLYVQFHRLKITNFHSVQKLIRSFLVNHIQTNRYYHSLSSFFCRLFICNNNNRHVSSLVEYLCISMK